MKTKKISQSFQRWLLVVVVIAFLVTTTCLWLIQTKLSERNAIDLLKLNISDVRQDILDASDENLLALAHQVAGEINRAENPDSGLLLTLIEKYDLAEANIINDRGIITATTHDPFLGYDMATGAQSAEFMVLLQGEEEYAQSYQPTSSDGSLSRKYGGVTLAGDTRQLGTIGKKLLSRFMLISTLFGVVCMAASVLVFRPALTGAQSGQAVLQSVIEMVLDIIPGNIVEPFLSGNTLQILFMGAVVGVVMIILQDRMQVMTQVVEQANAIVQLVLGAISGVTHIFIFLSVLRLILQGTLTQSAAGLFQVILLSVVFMSHAVNVFVLIPLFTAQVYGVELTVGSLVMCVLNAVILSVAAPPIPGGAISCYTLMFLQLGIPLEAISLAVAANVVLDFTCTAGNLHALLVQLAHGAKKLGMLDETILLRQE